MNNHKEALKKRLHLNFRGIVSSFWYVIAAVMITIIALFIDLNQVISALVFAFQGLLHVAPMVIPGILLAAWIIASGADTQVANVFEGRLFYSVVAAAAIGAVTPVCGVTVLPLMASLLAGGVPLAPIMAFWLSSPITDPAMLTTTAAVLGITFAIGKTIAAFTIGLFGGFASIVLSSATWYNDALRSNQLTQNLNTTRCCGNQSFLAAIWLNPGRRLLFYKQLLATSRLMLVCLVPAFVAEYALNAMLTPDSLAGYVGNENRWAIPIAVFVGAPAYIDGYAALPLTRALLDNGMSPGAAMAFLVSGGVVSIWGALAIAPVLKLPPFMLFLILALVGSLSAGYVFEWYCLSWVE